MCRIVVLLLCSGLSLGAIDNQQRLNQHKVTSRGSPASEPGAENERIPSLLDGLRTPDDWYRRKRPELLELWTRILGKLGPDKQDRKWFGDIRKVRIVEKQELEKYTRVELDLPIEKDFYQHHLLLLPKNQGSGPFPAVVCWSSSSPDFRTPEQWWGKWLAENGYVVLTSWSFIRYYRDGTTARAGAPEKLYERFGHWLPIAKMVHDASASGNICARSKKLTPAASGSSGFPLGPRLRYRGW